MGSIEINGKKIDVVGSRVLIQNGKVIVDGNTIEDKTSGDFKVVINGYAGDVECVGSVEVNGNVNGDIRCGGDIRVEGNTHGDINCDGSCTCHDVIGYVDSDGYVNLKDKTVKVKLENSDGEDTGRTIELKECPFCGSLNLCISHIDGFPVIICDQCFVEIIGPPTIDMLVEMWNKRNKGK